MSLVVPWLLTGVLTVGAGPCLPPGFTPEFFGWAVGRAGPIHPVGVFLRFEQGGQRIIAVWVPGGLAFLDDAPDTPQPAWADLGLVTPEGRIRDAPEPSLKCRWERIQPSVGPPPPRT